MGGVPTLAVVAVAMVMMVMAESMVIVATRLMGVGAAAVWAAVSAARCSLAPWRVGWQMV